jgi:hypothetical protein
MPLSKRYACCLWAQWRFDTFHHGLIIVTALWLQPVLQVGKWVVVTWSEIKAVRRVDMLNSAWWAAVCGSTLPWRNTTSDVSIPCPLFWMALHIFIYCFTIHFWHCGPLLNEFPPPFFFWCEYVYIHYFDCSLASIFINETQVSSPVACMMWMRNWSLSLWYHCEKVKAEAILSILCSSLSIFGTLLAQHL